MQQHSTSFETSELPLGLAGIYFVRKFYGPLGMKLSCEKKKIKYRLITMYKPHEGKQANKAYRIISIAQTPDNRKV